MLKTPIETINRMKAPTKKQGLNVSVTEPGAPKRITMLVYGLPGSGKTHLAGTFPNPLFVDMNAGLMTIRHKNIPYVRPKNAKEDEGYTQMLECTIPDNVKDYKTIVFDQLTDGTQIIMDGVLAMASKPHEVPWLEDWQFTIERLRRVIVALTGDGNLPDHHIVCIAEEKLDKDEVSGRVHGIVPDVPGKFSRRVGAHFDCVFHLATVYDPETKKKARRLLTEPDTVFYAKDRLGGLDKLEEPDFEVIWNKVSK